jgi:RNA polymerase sigma-70 factor (ECF subfamily)
MGEADEKIIGQVLNGNRNAYALLVDKYKDRVYSLALGIVRNRELAEEIAQDAFVKAFGSLKKFRKEASFSTWIYRITYNAAISELRKKKRTSQVVEEQFENLASAHANDTLAESNEKEARLEVIEKVIKSLAPEEQLLITLYYYEAHSVQQISKATGFSVSNVKVKLFRLRNKLRQMVESIAAKEIAVY